MMTVKSPASILRSRFTRTCCCVPPTENVFDSFEVSMMGFMAMKSFPSPTLRT